MRLPLLLTFAFLVACAAGHREKTLKASFVGVGAAKDGFVTWDERRQARIVEDATSLAEGTEALAAYRAQRARVVALFEAAYKAIAQAATHEDASVGSVLTVLKELRAAVQALRSDAEAQEGPAPAPGPAPAEPAAPAEGAALPSP